MTTEQVRVSRRKPGKAPAAIAVFAFKRLELVQRTLQSLGEADGFVDAPVYVFSDGARDDIAREAEDVAAVREWLRDWCTMNRAQMFESSRNRGLRPSIISGVTGILEKHDHIIVLEDDLIVSPSFLTFMNDALEAYEDRDEIMQVSGYFIPHSESLPPIGLLRTPGSWGWGTWRRAWRHYRDDAVALLAEICAGDPRAFDVNGSYGYREALQKNAEGTLDTWAVRWYASMFLMNGLAVHPSESLTRNIGFGDDATNCGPSATAGAYMSQRIARRLGSVDWDAVGTVENKDYVAALEGFYRWQRAEWAKPTWRQRIQARWELLAGGDATA